MRSHHFLWLIGASVLMTRPIAADRQETSADTLIKRASRVTSTADWMRPDYVWLSDEQLIAFKGKMEDGDDIVEKAVVFSIKTGRYRSLDAFNKQWQRWVRKTGERAIQWASLSPDRQWLLWQPRYAGTTIPDTWIVATLEDRRWIEEKSLGGLPPSVWFRDSRGWIAMQPFDIANQPRVSLLKYALADPGGKQEIDLTSQVEFPGDYNAYELLGFLPDGRILAALFRRPIRDFLSCFAAGITTAGTATVQRFRIQLPKDALLDEVVLSPRGDRLAWLFEFVTRTGSDSGRDQVGTPEKRTIKDEFWLSQWDGSGMKRLGLWEEYSINKETEYAIRALQWAPDGKRLSFIQRGTLYILPVD